MCDYANFLCCFNNQRIYCLEYTCLILSIILFPCNLFGLIIIRWEIIEFYCEIIYSINITISVFVIFIISLVFYLTKIGKLTSNEYYRPVGSISIMAIILYIYLFITFSLSTFQISKDYLKYINKQNNHVLKTRSKGKVIKEVINSELTWILLSFTTYLPTIISLINILVWISIYIRINYQIECSFNKGIRKHLRELRKNNKTKCQVLQETNSVNENKEKENIQKSKKYFVSIVMEKDRHPQFTKYVPSGENNNQTNGQYKAKNQLNKLKNKNRKGEYIQSDIISSERNFANNNIPQI